jgi:hypothetical protein
LSRAPCFKTSLKLALDKNIDKMQVYQEYKLVMEWVKSTYRFKNLALGPLLEQIKFVVEQFSHISFQHVYKEYNTYINELPKQVII